MEVRIPSVLLFVIVAPPTQRQAELSESLKYTKVVDHFLCVCSLVCAFAHEILSHSSREVQLSMWLRVDKRTTSARRESEHPLPNLSRYYVHNISHKSMHPYQRYVFFGTHAASISQQYSCVTPVIQYVVVHVMYVTILCIMEHNIPPRRSNICMFHWRVASMLLLTILMSLDQYSNSIFFLLRPATLSVLHSALPFSTLYQSSIILQASFR